MTGVQTCALPIFNWHTDLELLCVIAGSIELSVNGERLLLSGDDLVLINPNEGHATLGLDADATAMVLHIDPVFFKGYFEEAERTAIELRSVGSHAPAPAVPRLACIAGTLDGSGP